MKRLKLYTAGAFGSIVLLMLIVTAITYLNLTLIEDYTRTISSESIPHELITDVIEINILKTQELLTDTALTGQTNGFAQAEGSAKQVFDGLEKSKAIARKNDETAVLREIEFLEGEFLTFYETGKAMTSLYLRGETAAGNNAMIDFDARGENLLEKYESIRDLQVHKEISDAALILSTIRQAKVLLIATCLIAICVAVIAAAILLSLKENSPEGQ